MSFYNQFIKPLFFSRRFYVLYTAVIVLFILAYYWSFLYLIAEVAIGLLVLLTLLDYTILFLMKNSVDASRLVSDRFSNGDENKVQIVLKNSYPFHVKVRLIDEMPEQF